MPDPEDDPIEDTPSADDAPKPKRERVTGRMILDKLDELSSKIGGKSDDGDSSSDDGDGVPEVTFEPEPPAPPPTPDAPKDAAPVPQAPVAHERRSGFPRRGR